MVWAVGYLTHAKPAGDGSFAVDGRLDSYLRQRFAELISKFGRRARSCSPATSSAGRADDLADASMSKPAASEAEMVEWLDSRGAAPRSSRGSAARRSPSPSGRSREGHPRRRGHGGSGLRRPHRRLASKGMRSQS
jgi:hypothetical protein